MSKGWSDAAATAAEFLFIMFRWSTVVLSE